MKVLKKVSIIFICALLITIPMHSIVFSASTDIYSTITNLAGSSKDSSAVSSVNNMAGAIISMAKVICAGVAIIMLTVIAMK